MKQYIILLLVFLFATNAFAQIATKDTINQMEEVEIKLQPKSFTYKNGNVKVEVANSILSGISNPLDLISKLPKVQISADRAKIFIVGKGNPLIYLDNQRIQMNDLLALSVFDIKSIEIINNPSAKYEAEGKVVLLITRKFSTSEGFQTSISETSSFKKKFNNYLGVNSNLKFNKTELKANFNYNKLNPWESNANNYEIPANEIISDYNVAGFTKRNNYIYGAGIYQTLNNDDSFSLSINGNLKVDNFDFKTKTNYRILNDLSQIETVGLTMGNRNFINAVANYNKKFSSNSNLFAGMQYSSFVNFSNINSSNNYNQTTFEPFQIVNQHFKVDVFSARIDFDKKFENEMKLEVGVMHNFANANTNLVLNDFQLNNDVNSRYIMKEKNTSAYSQISGVLKKVSWLAGIRAENTIIKGKYDDASSKPIDKNYINLFPKLQAELTLDSTKTISFNYAKSITRPSYSETSNGQTSINPYFVFSSNINLNPTISDEIYLNFQYKNKSLKLTYYTNKDVMNYGFQYNATTKVLNYRPDNFDFETGYNLEFTLPFKYRIWSSDNVISFNLSKFEDKSATFGATNPYLYIYSNQTFNLNKDWTFSLVGWGITNQKQGIFERDAMIVLDSSISKRYQNWTCTLSYNNIFRGGQYKERIENNFINSQAIFFNDTNEFSIALKYIFGKLKNTTFREKTVDENGNRVR
ncbi:outer membrane beta-barrel family protein [Flavobacterium antarcticum]|uniref:outer membrane beta-barrel family protein n=1 Tax=Flavobacterium antarcticum TaxID=271155 RepID=UPI0003B4F688|nr:outer membrane beta-barrel family protein [Flavobacterium antarcticum]